MWKQKPSHPQKHINTHTEAAQGIRRDKEPPRKGC